MTNKLTLALVIVLGLATVCLAAIPSFIPVYPGAEVNSSEGDSDCGNATLIIYPTSKKTSSVAAWYVSALKKKGWVYIEKESDGYGNYTVEATHKNTGVCITIEIGYNDDRRMKIDYFWEGKG